MIGVDTKVTARSLDERLEELLSESVESAKRRERSAFDELAEPFEERLVLFGCGGLGRKTLTALRRVGLDPLCFTDNNSALWGKSIDGVSVVSPADAAAKYGGSAAFVVTIWNGSSRDKMADRIHQLAKLGCDKVIPFGLLFWKYADTFLPCYPVDLPHKVLQRSDRVRAALHLWCDDISKREYVAQVAFRLRLNFDGLGPATDDHYFAQDVYRLQPKETLIDCGAFDGDTIRSFLARQGEVFTRIVAYEPDALNWGRLQRTVLTLPPNVQARIECFPQAVGAVSGSVPFEVTGTDLSTTGSGSTLVECVKLDDCLEQVQPTIIKFDIEGAESDAIAGGSNIIRRHHPVLAVSTYHLQHHLWEIPLSISRITGEYGLFLRPHGSEGWDLVCYAVPPSRVIESRRDPGGE